MEAQEIIQEALEVGRERHQETFLGKLFFIGPSESKIKSNMILYLTDKFITERNRADKAEQKMYEGISDCIGFVEQREPQEARYLRQKYLI